MILTVNGFSFFLQKKNTFLKYGVSGILGIFFLLQLPINLDYYAIKPQNSWDPAQSNARNALETILKFESTKRAAGYVNWATVRVRADSHAYFPTQFYLNLSPDSAAYTKALQDLNLRYSYVLSGVESFQPEGAGTMIDFFKDLSQNPGIYHGVSWYVVGNPEAIDRIEPILNTMPDRILYRKKFSYGSLVFLLRT